MLLAFSELKYNPLRYSLITALIALISYLMFILSALTLGLASQSTAAINSWQTSHIALAAGSDQQLRNSLLDNSQTAPLQAAGGSAIGYAATELVVPDGKTSATFLGLNPTEPLAAKLPVRAGRQVLASHELLVDAQLTRTLGIKLGAKVQLGLDPQPYTVVGLVDQAKMSVGPVVYGMLADWGQLKRLPENIAASAVVGADPLIGAAVTGVEVVTTSQFIAALPGYTAQNQTFTLLIAIMAVVALVLMAVFLYILLLQNLSTIAVMKAQGIPSSYLIKAVLLQAALLAGAGLAVAGGMTLVSALLMPPAVPLVFNTGLIVLLAAGILLMAVLGALLPALKIRRTDPAVLIATP